MLDQRSYSIAVGIYSTHSTCIHLHEGIPTIYLTDSRRRNRDFEIEAERQSS